MKNLFFLFLSLILILSIVAPISFRVDNANAGYSTSEDLSGSGYSITGKVTDSLDNPVEDVTITATGSYPVYLPLVLHESDNRGETISLLDGDNKKSENISNDLRETMKKSNTDNQINRLEEIISAKESLDIPNSSYSTQTDENGNYSLTGLPAGKYTLVASQSGYSFTPANHIVTIPPSVTEQNFKIQTPDGMVFIEQGEFQMGCDPNKNGGYGCELDELPLHTVYLDDYFFDINEVTNDQMAAFLNSRGSNDCDGYECVDLDDLDRRISYTGGQYVVDIGYGDHPVVVVTWYGANAFCTENGKRLPSEAEWEKAARGTSVRAYPWEDGDPTCDLANFSGCLGGTAPVGSYLSGASPYGVLDMAGNVLEWVKDWYLSDYYEDCETGCSNPTGPATGTTRVLRGGLWDSNADSLRTAYRSKTQPQHGYPEFGFRCGSSSAPGE